MIDLSGRTIGTYTAVHSEVSEAVVTAMGSKAELLSRVGRHNEALAVQERVVSNAEALWGTSNQHYANEQLVLTLLKRRALINKESYVRKEQQALELQNDTALSRWQMLEVELYRACAFPFCSEIESDVTKFNLCHLCDQATYCSQKCQMDHWNAGHKKMCGVASGAFVGGDHPRHALDGTIQELTSETGQMLETKKLQEKEYIVRNRKNGTVVIFRVLGRDMVLRIGRLGWMMFAESLPQLEQLGVKQGSPEMDLLLDVNDYVVQAGDIVGQYPFFF